MRFRRWRDVFEMRLRSLLRRGRVERELEKELRFHLDEQIEENLASGMTMEEARATARRKLGGVAQIQEECRDTRRTGWIENLWRDLHYAVRTLRRWPGFAVVIVATLALAIGANSAIFSVIDGVLLRPLPYPQPERLVRIFFSNQEYPRFPLNPFDFRDFRTRNRSFSSMAAYTRADLQLSGSGSPVRLTALRVTAGFFRVLGFRPMIGRGFDRKDELPGHQLSVILSNKLWRDRFSSDRHIIGKKILLNSEPYTVVGVMPAGIEHPGNTYHPLAYGDSVDAWWPFTFEGNENNRGFHIMSGIGRLKKGVSAAQGAADLDAITAQLLREYPSIGNGWHVAVIPLKHQVVGRSERMLLVLLGAVCFVLLIACVNIANLLLARATARQREIAVRAALGAGRWRLVRQMLAESLLIAVIGGAMGALLALGGIRALIALLPANFPRAQAIHLNGTVLLFTFLIAIGTGVLFGLAPSLHASRINLMQSLHENGRSSTAGRRQLGLRDVLVVLEIGFACLLLIAAGLMLHSFVNLMQTNPGFEPEHILTASVSLPKADYKNGKAVARFFDDLDKKLNTIPGVTAAGIGTDVPWSGYDENVGGFDIDGKRPPAHEEFHARYHAAMSGYFRAMGIPLVEGRFFTEQDNQGSPKVMIINRRMARLYWPHEDPLGGKIAFTDHPKANDWFRIVGVVGNVKDTPESAEAQPAFWFSALQHLTKTMMWGPADMSVVIRGHAKPMLLANELREAVRQLNPSLAVADVRSMDEIANSSVSAPRFILFLVGLFAVLALTLAAVGLYGVVSYSVNQRRQEFGVRLALGAKPGDVLRLVMGQGIKLGLIGSVVGVFCALGLSRVLRSLLYGVSAVDPITFAFAGLTGILITALACYLPARRAMKTSPMIALRSE